MDRVVELLVQLKELLSDHELDEDADELDRLALLYRADRSHFADAIRDVSIWGGAGSVVDRGPRAGIHGAAASVRRDELRFRQLIVDLVGALAEQGSATEDMSSVGRAFRELNERVLNETES